ncbi:MAG: hypothetical protein AAFY73_04255 [Pseudomonadota bacterium]
MDDKDRQKLIDEIVARVDRENQKYMHHTALPHIEAVSGAGQHGLNSKLDDLLVLQAKDLIARQSAAQPDRLHDIEFRVFSQFGEDGILQYLIRESGIGPGEETFIEFGVENYREANTRFLLINNHWRGLVMDGSEANVATIRADDIYWRADLTAVHAWIDRDNINELITNAGFAGNIGLLSIDIDGNDYWVWERIDAVNPVIVAVEWNGAYGPDHAVSIPYDPAFHRGEAHYSHLYWGASISAFEHLARKKGYRLVGSNGVGNNIFFVREDRLGRLKALTPREAFVEPKFRDSRDENGNLTFLSGQARRDMISHLPLINVKSGAETTLEQLMQDS